MTVAAKFRTFQLNTTVYPQLSNFFSDALKTQVLAAEIPHDCRKQELGRLASCFNQLPNKGKILTISVFSINSGLVQQLAELLTLHGVALRHCDTEDLTQGLSQLYDRSTSAVVIDPECIHIPQSAWIDMITSLGRRIPVVVIGRSAGEHPRIRQSGSSLTWLDSPSAEEILSVLDSCGAVGLDFRRVHREVIPIYNPQVPIHMLQNSGALSILVIDASSFRKIAIEYGSDVYHRVQECFNQILYDQWGTAGCFRSTDVLARRTVQSNSYYIFLEQSRTAQSIPAPGVLEKLADRLAIRIQNSFWKEIFVERTHRMMPDCIRIVPDISIGFGTAIYNPCVDPMEVIEQLLETSVDESRVQAKRMRDRQRELMQSLIQTPGLLEPHYQGVFDLQKLTKDLVDDTHQKRSLSPIKGLLFGFESLIRVKNDAIDAIYDISGPVYLESRYLRPDVLFALSHSAKVGLELDQACLQQAIKHSGQLPGVLLLNILPRNLYNIDRLRPIFKGRTNLMFEVSESEAISNLELMLKVRESLSKSNMLIAADDFGKGYNGLEQIIRIKPDLIKLDRSLIQDIHQDLPKQAFVHGLVRAAQIAQSSVLAEGVELWEEAEVLKQMGINLIQGFLLHRPQPAAVINADLYPLPVADEKAA